MSSIFLLPVWLTYWPRKCATWCALRGDSFHQVWSWYEYDHPLPSYSIIAADMLRDLVTLTSDLLTSARPHCVISGIIAQRTKTQNNSLHIQFSRWHHHPFHVETLLKHVFAGCQQLTRKVRISGTTYKMSLLFRQIMLIITAGMENYQKNMLNPKKDGAGRYSQPLLTYSEMKTHECYLAVRI